MRKIMLTTLLLSVLIFSVACTPALGKPSEEDAEVFAHVFENHSVKLSEEEKDSFDYKAPEGKAAIIFALTDTPFGYSASEFDAYIVEGVSSENDGSGNKYSAYISSHGGDVSDKGGKVTHGYHERYLDVLFKYLPFDDCEALPTHSDGYYSPVYFVSSANEEYLRYNLYTDGYLYYTVKDEGGEEKHYRSTEKLDTAYLAFIAYNAQLRKDNIKTKEEAGYELHYNVELDISEPSLRKSFVTDKGDTVEYIEGADGRCYITDNVSSWSQAMSRDSGGITRFLRNIQVSVDSLEKLEAIYKSNE